jgi:hypothetical protein
MSKMFFLERFIPFPLREKFHFFLKRHRFHPRPIQYPVERKKKELMRIFQRSRHRQWDSELSGRVSRPAEHGGPYGEGKEHFKRRSESTQNCRTYVSAIGIGLSCVQEKKNKGWERKREKVGERKTGKR